MYSIDRDSDVALYVQIRDAIENAIKEGRLKVGDRLPSVSSLAKEIGVTQATVRRALQDLTESGLTDSHVGRGTFIREKSDGEDRGNDHKRSEFSQPYRKNVDELKISAARRMRTGVSKALYDIMPLAHKPGVIQLTRGVPDPDLLPEGFVDEVCRELLSKGDKHLVQATEPQGMYALRAEIARRESERGVSVGPDQVLITNGVSQAISLVGQSLLESPYDLVLESPNFLGVANSFSAMGHWVETVRRDNSGPNMEQLARMSTGAPKLLYVCPYAHNPTGLNMTTARTLELVRWARDTSGLILTDEIFRDLRFRPSDTTSLLRELGAEQTIVVNSLSKTVMTGMRLGWVISSPQRIKELTGLKKLMDQASPTLIQAMALSIFKSGRYEGLVGTLQGVYEKRTNIMHKALKRYMPQEVTWSKPEGGFSMMLELPNGYSSVALLLFAVEKGVSFLPGPLFDIDHRYVNAMRLSCAWSDEHEIKEGVQLLADAVGEFISKPPEDSGLSGLGGYQ
ncbi:PLP-dependent aminotransferase family protein [Desulfopila sp. IMCC35008]|uniref:aminotransferase-like domain-containing protein n=1 Tax=Desulfopila sp. IMCC35008 TaxID=2653858 RepID=UPI0013D5B298|nr:PLP-dependent aminotransferase family protein [Desulfopila sp. IMCC35008]